MGLLSVNQASGTMGDTFAIRNRGLSFFSAIAAAKYPRFMHIFAKENSSSA
jgi:hypothetical protein